MIKSNPVVALVVGAEDFATGERSMINIEDPDVVQLAVDYEEAPLVVRERQAVGLSEVCHNRCQVSVLRIPSVDVTRADLRGGFVAFVVGVDAVAGIGEPNRSIRMLHDIVWAVQPVAVV